MAEPEVAAAPPPLLTVGDVCRILRIHVNTLKRMPASDLPYVRFGTRGDRRYQASDIEAYVAKRTVTS